MPGRVVRPGIPISEEVGRGRFRAAMARLRREVKAALDDGTRRGCKTTSGSCAEILRVEESLWTFAARLAQLIREEFGVGLNPRYLSTWLRERGFTPQKPQRVARERDPKAVAAWRESDWPRITKRPGGRAPTSP